MYKLFCFFQWGHYPFCLVPLLRRPQEQDRWRWLTSWMTTKWGGKICGDSWAGWVGHYSSCYLPQPGSKLGLCCVRSCWLWGCGVGVLSVFPHLLSVLSNGHLALEWVKQETPSRYFPKLGLFSKICLLFVVGSLFGCWRDDLQKPRQILGTSPTRTGPLWWYLKGGGNGAQREGWIQIQVPHPRACLWNKAKVAT